MLRILSNFIKFMLQITNKSHEEFKNVVHILESVVSFAKRRNSTADMLARN